MITRRIIIGHFAGNKPYFRALDIPAQNAGGNACSKSEILATAVLHRCARTMIQHRTPPVFILHAKGQRIACIGVPPPPP